ncbi:MAG: MFS transporter [Chloroflexi bacterium]|nr:MFS transporter [Chloroflexota bacterium]
MLSAWRITPQQGFARRWPGLLFIGISLLVISLDNTVLNVALPAIARTLNASLSDLQWIVDAYILVFAALLLTMGGLGDRYGRKKTLQIGLLLFAAGSLAAALSTSTALLIASRAFLGIGGALIMPSTLSILTATFADEERPRAVAIWAAIFGLGVGVGPLIGGWLLQYFEWSAVFYVNLPVIAVALLGGALTLYDSRDEHPPQADIPGVLLSIAGLFALVYGIIRAGQESWTETNVLVAFALAAVLLALFAWWENRNPDAMLPLYLFKNPSFTGASVTLTFVMFSLFGSLFFVSQYLQTVQGYTALEAGIRILPIAVTLAIFSALSARVAQRFGTKRTVAAGIMIAALGLLLMSQIFRVDTPYWMIAVTQAVLATGMGLAVSPVTNSVMGAVPLQRAGIGSAMNDTTRQLGGALGVAVLGTIMNTLYQSGVQSLEGAIPVPAALAERARQAFEAIQSSVQAAHIVAEQIRALPVAPEGAADTIINTANAAFVAGMDRALLVGAITMLAGALFALVVLPAQVQRSPEFAERAQAASD